MSTFVGIDIGSHLVKVVELGQKAKSKKQLVKAFMFATPYENNAVKKINSKELMAEIIRQIPLGSFRDLQIAVNIPSSLVNVIVVTLPKMNRKELAVAAISETKRKMIPAPGPNSIFEHLFLGEVTVGKALRHDVLVVKTEKENIKDILGFFTRTGNNIPSLIAPSCYVAGNLFPADSPIYQQDTAFIDLGYNALDVTITKRGKLYFYRNVAFGLKDVIAQIAAALNIDLVRAETAIKNLGVPEIPDVDVKDKVKIAEEVMRQKYEASLAGTAKDEINALELRLAWETAIERFIHEIRRSIIYYKEQIAGARVENIFFLGGGAKIKGLYETLSKELGGNKKIVEPFKDANIDTSAITGDDFNKTDVLYATAASLALTLPLLRKKTGAINFLPQEFKKREANIRRQVIAGIVGLVFSSVLAVAAVFYMIDNNTITTAIKRIDRQIERAQNEENLLDNLKQEKKELMLRSAQVMAILEKHYDFAYLLSEIASLAPEKVYLKEIFINKGEPTVNPAVPGAVSGNKLKIVFLQYADYEEALAVAEEFKNKLSKSEYLTDLSLEKPEIETIAPYILDRQGVVLTLQQEREFSLQAELR